MREIPVGAAIRSSLLPGYLARSMIDGSPASDMFTESVGARSSGRRGTTPASSPTSTATQRSWSRRDRGAGPPRPAVRRPGHWRPRPRGHLRLARAKVGCGAGPKETPPLQREAGRHEDGRQGLDPLMEQARALPEADRSAARAGHRRARAPGGHGGGPADGAGRRAFGPALGLRLRRLRRLGGLELHQHLQDPSRSATRLAAAFGNNTSTLALFGPAPRLQTVGGFTVFKVSMTLTIIGAVWGLLTSSRLLRGEEDAGRWDLLLSGRTTGAGRRRRHWPGSAPACSCSGW